MVTMRSSSGIKLERTLSSVVLPEPVPPATTMLSLATTQALRKSPTTAVTLPNLMRSSMPKDVWQLNFRMVIDGPSTAHGANDGVDA